MRGPRCLPTPTVCGLVTFVLLAFVHLQDAACMHDGCDRLPAERRRRCRQHRSSFLSDRHISANDGDKPQRRRQQTVQRTPRGHCGLIGAASAADQVQVLEGRDLSCGCMAAGRKRTRRCDPPCCCAMGAVLAMVLGQSQPLSYQ